MVLRPHALVAGLILLAVATGALPAAAQAPSTPLRSIAVDGAHYFSDERIAELLRLRPGAPLPTTPARLAEQLRDAYEQEGYAFAQVAARFDTATGRLGFTIDEGRIDAVEFRGVPPQVARQFAEEFSLQPGDIFRQPEAGKALGALLEQTQGAVEAESEPDTSTGPAARRPFDLLVRGGRRVLVVRLATRRHQFKLASGTRGREDWFSPVDGFSPAIGFDHTIFAPASRNHAFITGRVSYKFGADRAGYSLGFERPFLDRSVLVLGAEIHDETASDDVWRLSATEQSLAAAGLRKSFRDYYRRRGYQLNAALRLGRAGEVQVSWRDERQEPLVDMSEFSIFNSDDDWRPNAAAQPGRLHSVVLAYAFDSRVGLADSRPTRYERHQLASVFGTYKGREPGWRVEWTSEIAQPDRLGGDFDFRRHVLNVRRYNRLSPRHALDLRGMVAWTDGLVPVQRQLALGGVGTVPGYRFKESAGEGIVLLNAEYRYRPWRDVMPLVTYDAGRSLGATIGTSGWMHTIGGGVTIGEGFRFEVVRPIEGGRGAHVLIRFTPTF